MKNTFAMLVAFALILPAAAALAQAPGTINPVIWKVNGEPIYAAEISMLMQNLAAQARQAGAQPTQEELAQAATDRMIQQKLLTQEARRYGVKNDPAKVERLVSNMEQQAGGRANLEKMLAGGGSSYEQAVNQLRDIDLVMQFIDTQIAPTIKVSDEEVAAYYKDNPELFSHSEQVHARHIIYSADENADEATATAARKKAEAAHERALAGEDFATLATELSEGPSAGRGGDLGFFSREDMVKPFSDAAFALKVDEISPVVRTRFGFHVITIEEHRAAGTIPFAEISERIATVIRQQKVSETLDGLVETLSKNGTIEQVPVKAPASAGGGE